LTFSDVDRELRRWYNICAGLGADSVPPTMAVLRQRAEEIAANLGVTGFSASAGFVRRWAERHNLVNISLWGTGASAAADVESSQQRMAEIRTQLEAYDPEQIYNMNETGLYFRFLPNRAYVSAGSRRRARGSKAMKDKDRVTLVLAVNATGSHKIPVAVIGKAAVSVCFKPPRAPCPLPYFSQKSAWMDGEVYEKWFNTVFVTAVWARTQLPCILIVDTCGAHGKLKHPQVAICPLLPNVTSVHQPLDSGIIAALKRRYKGRLLGLVIGAFQGSQLAAVATDRTRQPPVDPRGGRRRTAAGRPVAAVGIARRAPVDGAPIAAVGTPGRALVAGAGGGVATAGGGLGASSTAGVRGQRGVAAAGGDALAGQARAALPCGAGHGGGTPPSVYGALASGADTAVQRGEAGGGGNLTGVGTGAVAAPHIEIGKPPRTPAAQASDLRALERANFEPLAAVGGSVGAHAAFGGALSSEPAWVRVRGATLAGEFLSRTLQATPRLVVRNASRRGDTLAFPLGGVCQSGGASIPAGTPAGAQPGTLERPSTPQGGVNTVATGAADGRVGSAIGPAHALDAITPAGAPTVAAPGVRVEPLDSSSPASIWRGTLEANYTPPVVTGFPADPAPAEPNVWAEPPAAASPRPDRRLPSRGPCVVCVTVRRPTYRTCPRLSSWNGRQWILQQFPTAALRRGSYPRQWRRQ